MRIKYTNFVVGIIYKNNNGERSHRFIQPKDRSSKSHLRVRLEVHQEFKKDFFSSTLEVRRAYEDVNKSPYGPTGRISRYLCQRKLICSFWSKQIKKKCRKGKRTHPL